MMKRVSVKLKTGSVQEYENVSRIEEEKHYDNVIAIRLYDRDGELMAIIDAREIANLSSQDT
ncbi:MAG: hypothetical protein WCD12_05765 [Candidatus Binatus sp.]|jgi:hypothetical protein|uniref:hypothetical protein n=1 Tax=Candidatus Binatus sp. TaxID=2811406 RepID=UPI003C75FB0E